MSEALSTKDRILQAAIQLFVDLGIRRVSMDDVADRSGVSRVTLYRYFADREALVRAAFLAPIEALEQLQGELVADDDPTVEGVLGAIGERIAEQPAIDLPVHRDELEKLYPVLAAEYAGRRDEVAHRLISWIFGIAERSGRLRAGVRKDLVEGVVWDLLVNPHSIPAVRESGIQARELYAALIDVLLYGMLSDGGSS
ncbi:MAG: TetR/AcrR family transcriptional regulator [Acidimicrobiia bacterium]|nr:TetR/AcrR family transcriptional regulator [Acidimicrobiia bacterium]